MCEEMNLTATTSMNDEHKNKQKLFQMKFSYLNEPKKRKRTTPEQVAILTSTFEKNSLPTPKQRKMIAQQTGMTTRAIQVWFQNKRAKLRTKQKPRPKTQKQTSSKVKLPCILKHVQELMANPEQHLVNKIKMELKNEIKEEIDETENENENDEMDAIHDYLQIDESDYSDDIERNESSTSLSPVSSPSEESFTQEETNTSSPYSEVGSYPEEKFTSQFTLKLETEEVFDLEDKYYFSDLKQEFDECLSPIQFYHSKREFVC